MNEQAKTLIEFVISEKRVHPNRWHNLYQIKIRGVPGQGCFLMWQVLT